MLPPSRADNLGLLEPLGLQHRLDVCSLHSVQLDFFAAVDMELRGMPVLPLDFQAFPVSVFPGVQPLFQLGVLRLVQLSASAGDDGARDFLLVRVLGRSFRALSFLTISVLTTTLRAAGPIDLAARFDGRDPHTTEP